MAEEDKLVELESLCRLSHSLLWTWEANYFEKSGIDAWSGVVPYFATSNPFIANSYAQIMISYIRDQLRSHQASSNSPFYIVELGAGSGQFAFYCVRRLQKLNQQLGLNVDICYVMMDIAKKNLQFWKNQEVLQPYIESGILDMACYNLHDPGDIILDYRHETLHQLTNPLIVVGNYVLDSTRQDAFHIEEGGLYETLITIKSERDNLDNSNQPKVLKNLRYEFDYRKIDTHNYYQNTILNHILDEYANNLSKGNFVLSVDIFKALDHLRKQSADKLLLIVSDKAYTDQWELENREDPHIVFHGNAFSLTANFNALGKYFTQQDGFAFHQSASRPLKTSAFILGASGNGLYDTYQAIEDKLWRFGPGDYYYISRQLRREEFNLESCLIHMQICDWDPYILTKYISVINENLPTAADRIKQGFLQGVAKAETMIYPMPAMDNHFFTLGTLYYLLTQYDCAITCYQKALTIPLTQSNAQQTAILYFHIGICYHSLGDQQACLSALKRAQEYDSNNADLDEWVSQLEQDNAV